MYRWTRNLHLYVGLFMSPFLLIYAVSVILLNHPARPAAGQLPTRASETTVRITDQENSLDLAKDIRGQLGLTGEIGYVNRNRERQRLSFPIDLPGRKTVVRVDLATGGARIERTETGIGDAMNYLHKMPGPHNVAIRGNSLFMSAWRWLADATVYLVLFLSASGVYLWLVLKAERKAGLLVLGAGMATLVGLLMAIVP